MQVQYSDLLSKVDMTVVSHQSYVGSWKAHSVQQWYKMVALRSDLKGQ